MRLEKMILFMVILQAFLINGICLPSTIGQPQNITDDELDQSQPYYDFYCGVGCDCCKFAQSFTPSLDLLTRVELFMNGSATVSIRNDLNGSDLTSVYAEKDSLRDWDWVTFDFENVLVEPGHIYYIIWNPDDTLDSLGCKDYNIYENGASYYFNCDEWVDRDGDFTFKTYGRMTKPIAPTITGPTDGVVKEQYTYTMNAYDPDNDQLYYYIDWGDGQVTSWLGPYESGESIPFKHTWENGGTFNIKAQVKDIWGATSDWSEEYSVYMAEPDVVIDNVKGGFGVSADIRNVGDAPAKNLTWSIDVDGFILIGGHIEDTIASLEVNQAITITSVLIIGFGKAIVTISVGNIIEKQIECIVIGPMILLI